MGASKWRVDIDPSTETLVIGDSNLGQMKSPPAGWQIECFPGCSLQQLPALASKTSRSDRVTSIIIAVGINNKSSTEAANEQNVKKLSEGRRIWMDRCGKAKVMIAGVSIPRTITEAQQQTLEKLNAAILDSTALYIPPLKKTEVEISPTDTVFRIHYSARTANRILDGWKDFVAASNLN